MNIIDYISNPHKRIQATHFLVVAILIFNIVFFTENTISIIIQVVLIIAVIIHNQDDRIVKKRLESSEKNLLQDAEIFDRNIIVSEADLSGNITYVNSNFCEISGYDEAELIGKPHSLLRDPEMPSEFFKEFWNTIKSGKTFHGVIKNRKKNGSAYWIDASIIPIHKNGKITGYKAIRFDITDKIIARETYKQTLTQKDTLLEEQSKRFEFAINSSRDGFWDFDVESQEFYLSSGWKKRLGFSEDEKVTYLKYLALMPDENRVEYHDAMHEVIQRYTNHVEFIRFRIRYPLITKAGERLLIEDVGDAFFDDKKNIKRMTGFHRDITDQERQSKMLESQNRVAAMGDMLGNIAHQWRQPIGAINNALNDVEFDIELEDLEHIQASQFMETSKKVKEFTSHLSQTIDDFRKLSSDDKVKSKFLLTAVLDEAKNLIDYEYKKYNIGFEVELVGEYICEISGYKRELLQVVINILNNAKDIFVEKEILNAKVDIKLSRDDDNVYLSIHDNAGGIPEAILEKIFDPYFTTKHESIGTGIGLFMSKKMITEHFNGILAVHNENSGAKFMITLPREDK